MESIDELMPSAQLPVKVFFCYAQEDERLRRKLEIHLSPLRRLGLISSWHDRCIIAGTDWIRDTEIHLEIASVILLLVSANFLASDYCYSMGMKRALERHQDNEARVIPILLRPVEWKRTPFGHLRVLPTDEKPISIWRNVDQAFTDVADGIRRVIEDSACFSVNSSNEANYIYLDAESVMQVENASSQKYGASPRACEFSKICRFYHPMHNA